MMVLDDRSAPKFVASPSLLSIDPDGFLLLCYYHTTFYGRRLRTIYSRLPNIIWICYDYCEEEEEERWNRIFIGYWSFPWLRVSKNYEYCTYSTTLFRASGTCTSLFVDIEKSFKKPRALAGDHHMLIFLELHRLFFAAKKNVICCCDSLRKGRTQTNSKKEPTCIWHTTHTSFNMSCAKATTLLQHRAITKMTKKPTLINDTVL